MNVAIDSAVRRPAMDPAKLGMWIFLATVTMLFAAFASAYLVRMTSTDWRPVEIPPILWINTGVLLLSSAGTELARRTTAARRIWLSVSLILGLFFIAGQASAWSRLAAQGVLLPSSPHAAFLYILTGLHAVHWAAGIVLLSTGLARYRDRRLLDLATTYWHFMAALWIGLFAVLHLG